MNALIGNFSLSLAMLAALVTFLASLAAGRFASESILRAGRWTLAGLFALLTVASVALLAALVQSDFSVAYVARYTERALPVGYKLAAFWAGQEGSLLLWAWLLAGLAMLAVFTNRSAKSVGEAATVLATLAVICGFFAALMLFAANPFVSADVVAEDGHGLNPMLQDPAMIAHPPALFLGYAGYAVPFALLVGALVAGRKDNDWVAATRRWLMVSWLTLSIGILLGAQWAYVELGWGGYWAWDPVENASLLPWFTGTALLHTVMVQQHRGMFKRWNASLIAATFILCIFGTYLTRSGVIDSVHAFGASLIGTFFLVALMVLTVFSVLLIVARHRVLAPERELEGLVGKEGFFLATNVLLVGMTLITLLGTTFPIISNVLAGQKVTVGPNFYNRVVAPMGLLLTALMALGPVLVYGRDAARRLVRGAVIPVAFAMLVVAVCTAKGLTNVWALIAAAIVAGGLTSVLVDLAKSTWTRVQTHGENPVVALIRLLDANHRRYGGQIVHIGVLMIVLGITFSSLFEQKQTFSLTLGQSVDFAGRTLTLVQVKPYQGANFEAAQAVLTMTNAAGEATSVNPQIRKYDKWEQLNSEVAIRSNWREDVYVTLASVGQHGEVTIQAIVNPLVSWIWTGGIVLTIGGVVGLLPRLIPSHAPAAMQSAPAVVVKSPRPTKGRVRVTTG